MNNFEPDRKLQEAAQKIQKAYRLKRLQKLLKDKKIPLDERAIKFFKDERKDFYEYIELVPQDKKNRLLYSIDKRKVDELINRSSKVAMDGWDVNIFYEEDLPFYVLNAFYHKLILASQRTTFLQRYWACKEFNKAKVSTFPIFNTPGSFTAEAKEFLAYEYGGALLQIDEKILIEAFKDLPDSEKFFTIIDITEYLSTYTKTLYVNIARTGVMQNYQNANGTYDVFIHTGAMQTFNKLLCQEDAVDFHAKLGIFDEDIMVKYMIEDKRLFDEKFPNITSLIAPHNILSKTRVVHKHDEFHFRVVSVIPKTLRHFYLINLRNFLKCLEKLFKDIQFPGTEESADLEKPSFYLWKFFKHGSEWKGEKFYDLERLKGNEGTIIFPLYLAVSLSQNKDYWNPYADDLIMLCFHRIQDFPLLLKITQKFLQNNTIQIDNPEDFYKIFIIMVKYLQVRLNKEIIIDVERSQEPREPEEGECFELIKDFSKYFTDLNVDEKNKRFEGFNITVRKFCNQADPCNIYPEGPKTEFQIFNNYLNNLLEDLCKIIFGKTSQEVFTEQYNLSFVYKKNSEN